MTAGRGKAFQGFVPGGGAGRNGMPGFHDYTYRGSNRLDDTNSKLCEGDCGRRLEIGATAPKYCAVCREAFGLRRGGH